MMIPIKTMVLLKSQQNCKNAENMFLKKQLGIICVKCAVGKYRIKSVNMTKIEKNLCFIYVENGVENMLLYLKESFR